MSTLLILELLASCLLALYLTFAISVHYSSCSCVCLHLAVVLVQQSSMGADAATGPQGPVHLVVLQHGLWGNTTDVSNLETLLRQQLRPQDAAADGEDSKHGPAADAVQQMHEEVQILNSDVNRKALTYDGIDVCGARVVKMVLDCIQLLQSNGRQVTKLSFIGYSLGGLILRYAVGKLYVLGLFEEVECANFITIATPHLGSWRSPTSFWARFFNSHVAVVGSRTGRQLMLADADYSVPWLTQQQQLHEQHTHQQPQQDSQPQKQQPAEQQQQQQQQAEMPPGVSRGQAVPLLLLMAHPCGPFHRALKGFRTRMVAANTLYDAMVPYCTAALCMSNPYEERRAVSIDAERYPSVVRPAGEGEVVPELTYKGRRKRLFLFALFSPLAPLLYIWTVTYGYLHHRSARKKALEGSWLQQHPQAAPAAADAITALGSSNLSSGNSRLSKQEPLLLNAAGTRSSATLAGAAGGDRTDTVVGASEGVGSTDGLISTAVEELGEGAGVGEDQGAAVTGPGSGRSSLEQAMQHVAAGSGDGRATAASSAPAAAVPAAAAAMEGSAAGLSRRRSDSLAAAVAYHQKEDELGRLSRQFVNSSSGRSKDSIKASLKGSAGVADVAGDSSSAAVGAAGGDVVAEAAAVVSTAAAAEASPAAAGSRVRVTVDRDGIVEAPSLLHVQQEWMARQLFENMLPCHVPDNTQRVSTQSSEGAAAAGTAAATNSGSSASSAAGRVAKKGGWTQNGAAGSSIDSSGGGSSSVGGWHRVDVCTRHWHAHAAIIIRDYRFAEQSRDMFQYLVDHMTL